VFPLRGAVRLSTSDPFLLFMTSRSCALRTRRSRCPAASRSCSPRRSVPLDGRSRPGPILSWVFVRLSRACPFRRRPGFPGPTLLRFVRPPYGRGGARRSRALPNGRGAAGLAARDNSLEVLHQNPALGFSREPWCPTDESAGQEHPCDTEPIRSRRTRSTAPPGGDARFGSEEPYPAVLHP
jgi:hypothetical protein